MTQLIASPRRAGEAEVHAFRIRRIMGCIILFPLQRGGQRLQGGLQYKLLKASNNTAFCTSLCKDGVCTLTTLTTPTTLTEDVSAVFEIVISASPSRSPAQG